MEKIIFKCKPTYNFQSVEFEYQGDLETLEDMFTIYKAVLNELMILAPEQPTKLIQPIEMATAKQKEIMDRFGIKYKSTVTKAEAQELIKKNLEELKK